MARYTMFIDQMQCHEQCTSANTDREHPGSDHCQHKSHADHGSTKAGNNLAAQGIANKLNDADDQDQQYDNIEAKRPIRQHSQQHENTAKYCAGQSDAKMPKRGGVVCHTYSRLDVQIW